MQCLRYQSSPQSPQPTPSRRPTMANKPTSPWRAAPSYKHPSGVRIFSRLTSPLTNPTHRLLLIVWCLPRVLHHLAIIPISLSFARFYRHSGDNAEWAHVSHDASLVYIPHPVPKAPPVFRTSRSLRNSGLTRPLKFRNANLAADHLPRRPLRHRLRTSLLANYTLPR